MRIDKLKENMRIKSYKELCKVLEVPEKTGKSKKIQIEDMERYFEYTKDGNVFIIKNIYPVVVEKIDDRSLGKGGLYIEALQALIIDMSNQCKEGSITLSRNNLLYRLNMVNKNYAPGRRYISRLADVTNVSVENCYLFYDEANNKLRGAVERALGNLRNRSLIIWTKTITVCIKNVYTDKNGKTIIEREFKIAQDYEKQLVLEAEKTTLNEMNCYDRRQVFLKGKWKYFIEKVNEKLKEENIEYYYDSYQIVYNYAEIKKEYERLKLNPILTKEEKEGISDELNENIQKALMDTANTQHLRANEKVEAWNSYIESIYGEPNPNDAFKLKPSGTEFLQGNCSYINTTKTIMQHVIDKKTEVDILAKPSK